MIQKNIHGSSRSPIKKQLAKRIVSYFDQLDDARRKERSLDKSPSRSRSRSASKKSIFEVERNIEHYQDVDVRKQKLEDLKELMKRELLKAKKEGATEVHADEVYHAVHGYPSFMKSNRTTVKYRKSPTKDANIQAFKKSIHRLLEERVLKAEGVDDPEQDSMDVSQLQNETQVMEDQHRSTLHSHSRSPGRSPGSTWKGPNLYDDILYSLETHKLILPHNQNEDHNYDFHQRKSKEIRRLQYVSAWRDRRSNSRPKVAGEYREHHQSPEKVYTGKDRKGNDRSSPSEGYPVWIRLMIGGLIKEIPAVLRNSEGFKINPNTDTMEVVENDSVSVAPYETAPTNEIFSQIHGVVERPNPAVTDFESECELVVQEPNGKRHPILFFLRDKIEQEEPIREESERSVPMDVAEPIPLYNSMIPEPTPTPAMKSRVMDDANIRAFDTSGKFLGRGRLSLPKYDKTSGEPVKYAKGILLNSEERIEFVLAKFAGDNSVTLKRKSLNNTVHNIDDNESMDLGGYKVKCLTLVERGPKATPELLFVMEGEHHLQKDRLLEGEEASVELEDYSKYDGLLQYESVPDDREGNLWLLVTSPHFDSSLARDQSGTPNRDDRKSSATHTFGPRSSAFVSGMQDPSLGQDRIRLELDDSDPERDISNLLDRIKAILDMRKPPATLVLSTVTAVEDSSIIDHRRTSEMNREDTLDLVVICPGGHRLRIYLRPKGAAAELDKEIEAVFGPPELSDGLMKMQFGDQIFEPDGIRVLKYPLTQRPRQLDKFDFRIIQFETPDSLQAEHEATMQRLAEEEREKHRRYLEEQLRMAEEEERLRKLREEEQRLHALRLEEERLKNEERARRLREEEERLKRMREEEEIRAREEAERLRQAAEEEMRVIRQREEEHRRRREEEEKLRLMIEEENKRIREENERKLREEEERMRLEQARRIREQEEEDERQRLAIEQERLRMVAEENERNRKEAEEAELKRREAEEAQRRKREVEEAERKRKEAEEIERKRRDAEELERKLRESMERKRREEEEEARRIAEEAEKRRLEDEARRKQAEEAERRRLEQEEARRKEAEEAEKRKQEEQRRKQKEAEEAERRRLEEEERLRKEREIRMREEEERRIRQQEELRQLEEERKAKEEAERRRIEEERRRLQEEEARRKLEKEEERRRQELLLAEQRRLDEEERVRLQVEEDRRLRESLERKRRQQEEYERAKLEEEEQRKRRELEERRRREEDEARLRASQDRRRREEEEKRKREEEERLRLQREAEEIEATQRKVRELKEALERSRVESSQDIHVIKKTIESSSKNNRYNAASHSSMEDSDISKRPKKGEVARLTVKDGQEVEFKSSRVSSKAASKASTSQLDKSKKSVEQLPKSIKYDPKRKSDQHRFMSHREHVTTTTTRHQKDSELIITEGSYTKIELNLENSQDDIDFIGYGTMRVSTKKSRSPSPELKTKFLKISPARNIPAEFEKDRLMTTRAFTPHSTYVGQKAQQVTSTSKKSVYNSSRYESPVFTSQLHEDNAAAVIQTNWRFQMFRRRLNTSREYHNVLAQQFSQYELFDKYCSFVRSLPQSDFSQRTFNFFITTIVGFTRS